jgi:hypothetical protein
MIAGLYLGLEYYRKNSHRVLTGSRGRYFETNRRRGRKVVAAVRVALAVIELNDDVKVGTKTGNIVVGRK